MVMGAGQDDTGHDAERRKATEHRGPGEDSTGNGTADAAGTASDLPDLRKLAQDWITLWQSELSAMTVDPELRESWQTVMAVWAGTISTILRALPREQTTARNDGPHGRSGASDAARAPAAAAAPDARDAEIDRLAHHVTALERRLAELERGDNPSVHPKLQPKRRSGRKSQR